MDETEAKIALICSLSGVLIICGIFGYFIFLYTGIIGLLIFIAIILIFVGYTIGDFAMNKSIEK